MLSQRQQKLLIIDSINYTRLVLGYTLERIGYKVATARNGEEVMQHISAELPDLILISLRATDASGISTLRLLKDYFRLRLDIAQAAEPPIIVLSAFRDNKQTNDVQSLGVSRILSKPINMQELMESVRTTISNKKNVVPQTRKNIIILDGETRSQQFLESILAHEMYDIEMADSESEFLTRIKNRNFDLAIVDLASLESGAIKVLKEVKALTDEMPILTMASYADPVSQDDIQQAGTHLHFSKPLNIDVFRTEVDSILNVVKQSSEETFEQKDQDESDSGSDN